MSEQGKSSFGRPKKQLSSLKEGWQNRCIDLGKKGASDVEIRAELGVTQRVFDRWMKEERDFRITIKKAHLYSQAWWERQGRENLTTKGFNTALWFINMKNRHGWRDQMPEAAATADDVALKIMQRLGQIESNVKPD